MLVQSDQSNAVHRKSSITHFLLNFHIASGDGTFLGAGHAVMLMHACSRCPASRLQGRRAARLAMRRGAPPALEARRHVRGLGLGLGSAAAAGRRASGGGSRPRRRSCCTSATATATASAGTWAPAVGATPGSTPCWLGMCRRAQRPVVSAWVACQTHAVSASLQLTHIGACPRSCFTRRVTVCAVLQSFSGHSAFVACPCFARKCYQVT